MRYRRAFLAVLAGAALVLPHPAAVPASDRPFQMQDQDERGGQAEWGGGGGGVSGCRPGTPAPAAPTGRYHGDRAIFGPAELPATAPVGDLLRNYRRFGALDQASFLEQYGNAAKDGWVYPPALGFVVLPDGRPVKFAFELQPGHRIDRFGFPGGSFLAPVGTPYARRALPPQSLNTPSQAPLANYHVYCVVKPFTVDAGPIAPWFAQPGFGIQFKLEQKYLPEAGPALNVTWLLANGYLVEEAPVPGDDPAVAGQVRTHSA
ncbi:hypothetical protein GCM10027280_16270 [Micromonospora polyrhachis]|uniref:TNT domain-containing protein n=1 Tax=Micromonospora polyrhachis TaxID=1282883 RepID=A0A7W7SRR6_9ACTN|nr:TNT domain-containing protein [Micromonospora polyrhachis]MBB4958485.1 hypothetical protein [Micromonospora polyrhachis]